MSWRVRAGRSLTHCGSISKCAPRQVKDTILFRCASIFWSYFVCWYICSIPEHFLYVKPRYSTTVGAGYLCATALSSNTLAMSLDRSAPNTLDEASDEQAPRHAMSACESHRRLGDPDATASAVALHRKKSRGRHR